MLSLNQLYAILEEERSRVLERFTKVADKHFNYKETKGTWSPELLFRHILMTNYWLLRNLPGGEELAPPAIALNPGQETSNSVTIDHLRDAFMLVSDVIKQRLSYLQVEEEEEIIETFRGKKPRQTVILGFIYHELRHLGQITWLFKRSTGWTDKEIYTD
jgi:uncharacterized damage-inducible protein DinB